VAAKETLEFDAGSTAALRLLDEEITDETVTGAAAAQNRVEADIAASRQASLRNESEWHRWNSIVCPSDGVESVFHGCGHRPT
jgi:hypothetical protein